MHLIVRVADHHLALPESSIVEVLRALTLTALPGAPDVVSGVFVWRGEVVPVFDMARRVGAGGRRMSASDMIVLARSRGMLLGLHVEEALDLVALADEPLTREPIASLRSARSYEDTLVWIQDLTDFLTGEEREDLRALLAEPRR